MKNKNNKSPEKAEYLHRIIYSPCTRCTSFCYYFECSQVINNFDRFIKVPVYKSRCYDEVVFSKGIKNTLKFEIKTA